MERLENLITEARALSQNERYDANSGISQLTFTRFFKSAQDTIYKAIQNTKSKAFKKVVERSIVSGQSLYSWPSDIYLQAMDTLEYSQDGQQGFIVLTKAYTKERLSPKPGYPFSYIPQETGYVLNPPLTIGTLRENYIRVLPSPEKRSGQISAFTQVGDVVSAITLDVAEGSFDPSYMNTKNYLCVVDAFGVLKAKGIPYTSVDAGTGVVTMNSHTLPSGESLAIGDYVVMGKYSTNLPELPNICEDFLIKYAVYSAKYGDSSQWTKAAIEDMSMCLQPIIDSFARLSDDITEVPITNGDYMGDGWGL